MSKPPSCKFGSNLNIEKSGAMLNAHCSAPQTETWKLGTLLNALSPRFPVPDFTRFPNTPVAVVTLRFLGTRFSTIPVACPSFPVDLASSDGWLRRGKRCTLATVRGGDSRTKQRVRSYDGSFRPVQAGWYAACNDVEPSVGNRINSTVDCPPYIHAWLGVRTCR